MDVLQDAPSTRKGGIRHESVSPCMGTAGRSRADSVSRPYVQYSIGVSGIRPGSEPGQRLIEIRDQVVNVLDADRQP